MIKTAHLLAFGLCLSLPFPGMAAPAASLKGKVYPAENKTLTAKESGYEVIQLTSSPAEDSGLYFTSQSFVPDENSLVFASKRTGSWNLFYMNLKTFEFVQLTDSKNISGTGAEVCAATHEVFYREGKVRYAVRADGFQIAHGVAADLAQIRAWNEAAIEVFGTVPPVG